MPEKTRSRFAGLAAFSCLPAVAIAVGDALMRASSPICRAFAHLSGNSLKKPNKKASHPTVGTRSSTAFVVPPEFEPAPRQSIIASGHGSSGEHGQTRDALPMLRLANGRLPANPTADHVNHGGSPLGLLLTEPFGGGASAGFHHPGSLWLSRRPRTFSVRCSSRYIGYQTLAV